MSEGLPVQEPDPAPLRYWTDSSGDSPLITAALCKVYRHPTLLGDLCRAHLDMLFDQADDNPTLEPACVRWFQPIREQVGGSRG